MAAGMITEMGTMVVVIATGLLGTEIVVVTSGAAVIATVTTPAGAGAVVVTDHEATHPEGCGDEEGAPVAAARGGVVGWTAGWGVKLIGMTKCAEGGEGLITTAAPQIIAEVELPEVEGGRDLVALEGPTVVAPQGEIGNGSMIATVTMIVDIVVPRRSREWDYDCDFHDDHD